MNTVQQARKLLGQCLWIGFEGKTIPADVKKFIQENAIGGVSLFSTNYESPEQVAELNNAIQDLRCKEIGLPIAIAVDHEGGKVQRFRKPFTHFPEARTIGDLDSAKLAFEAAEVMAKELKAVGINVIYAPVADIHTNPANPIIGNRAFGETEEHVSKMVSAQVRGFVTNQVHPVLKHFPGHGDTSEDSHTHLPKVSTDLNTLMARELRPFVKGFKSHCELVMTAHIIVESIDPKLPATLCDKILKDILRNQLRYRGLIISDDMEMKAVADHFGEVEAPLLALEAGVDLLLYHTMPAIEKMFEPLLSKLTSPDGKKALDQLKVSAARFADFRKKHFLPYSPASVEKIKDAVGIAAHQDVYNRCVKTV